MKVAHFAIFSPHAAGLYETTKELIQAERLVGLDAQFIDCGTDNKGTVREGLVDGDITTQPLSWAMDADIAVRHSAVPDSVYRKIPVIHALHGRPENSFRLEMYDIVPVITTVRQNAIKKTHKATFTFWKEHLYFWKQITGENIYYVPAVVDCRRFYMYGPRREFKEPGEINIVIVDRWREDQTPFNLIFAANLFKDKFCPGAKLHVYGAPVKKSAVQFLGTMQKSGFVGEVGGGVNFVDQIYRSADMILTPNIIATRVIREAMASGCPIVAPAGCKYTPYTAEPRDIVAFAEAMKRCYEETTVQKRVEMRERAMMEFDLKQAGKAMKNLCETVLGASS